MAYISAEDVKDYNGVQPSWIGQKDEETLDVLLERWITDASEMVDDYTKNSWTDETVPGGVKLAVLRIVANLVGEARSHRKDSVVNIDAYGGANADPGYASAKGNVFTREIKRDLDMYLMEQPIQSSISLMRVRSPKEIAEAQAPVSRFGMRAGIRPETRRRGGR